MSEDTDGSDGRSIDSVSRRRLLALAGVGAVGLAGCSGDGGSDTAAPTDSPTDTATPTAADTPTATPTATATATDTPTDSATATRSVQEKMARYGCPNLEKDGDYDIVVAQDGSGDHETVQGAIDALSPQTFEEQRVFIESGEYYEKLTLPTNLTDVTFIGEDPEETVITYDDHANKTSESGEQLGTFGTMTFHTRSMDFTAKDITFENDAEPVAQAIAARASGDRAMFDNCRFVGYQDTLNTDIQNGYQYYRNCYISGDVDFIFGPATSYFEDCEIFCRDQGYVSAASTPEDAEHGHVFNNCQIHGDAPEDSVYLGRPWKPYAQTVYLNCELGEVIRPEGWNPWHEESRPDKTETAFLAEYDNSGPGYAPEERPDWTHQLTEEEAQPYTDPVEIFDGWDPVSCL